jgi:hypothetical protein
MAERDPAAPMLAAFEAACAAGALGAAALVLDALESLTAHGPDADARARLIEALVEGHRQLWRLRRSEW